MKHYIDLLTKSHLFGAIVVLLVFIIFVFISIVIKKYFGDILKLVLATYIIYFPIGAFMSIYYRIKLKSWFPISNEFTEFFLTFAFLMLLLMLSRYMLVILRGRTIHESIFFNRENLETRLEVFTFFMLYANIFITIYTFICMLKLFF